MASVKIKFRPSTTDGGQGTLFYRVIHNRIARQQKTGYRLHANEWDSSLSEVVLPSADGNRKTYLSEIRNSVAADIRRFHKVIDTLEVSGHAYSADDVMAGFTADEPGNLLFGFMESVIARLKALGKARTRETYTTTLSSFKRFRKGGDLLLDDMDSDMMVAYEAYLKRNGVSPNTSSFYMRNLRAVYNRAVEKGLVERNFPLSTFIREWRRPPNGPYPLWQSGKSRSWTSHQARHWILPVTCSFFHSIPVACHSWTWPTCARRT